MCFVKTSPACIKSSLTEEYIDLEPDRSSNKRRFTDFVFQRVKPDELEQPSPYAQPGYDSNTRERVRSTSSHTTGGAPPVQATSAGAEARDALQRRAVRAQLLERQKQNFSSEAAEPPALSRDDSSHTALAGSVEAKHPLAARRFHLSRHGLTPASSTHWAGIRKHTHVNRPHVATFVEKHGDRLSDGEMHFSSKTSAIDRLIDDANFSPQPLSVMHSSSLDQPRNGASAGVGFSPKTIQSFVKAPKELVKTGNSIRDHPSTWNHDSDQLADELAAFALEISEAENSTKGGQQQRKTPARRSPEIADTDMEVDDIYVYETYLRVHRSELVPNYDENKDSIGVLVIEEQDQELWQTFAEVEEDSGWDEEDGDSNGRSIA